MCIRFPFAKELLSFEFFFYFFNYISERILEVLYYFCWEERSFIVQYEIIFSCSKHWHTDKFKVHLSWSSFPDKERRKSLSDEIKAILSGTRMIFVIIFNFITGNGSRLFV